MNAADCLLDSILDLPKTRVGDYQTFMDRVLIQYLKHIRRASGRSFVAHTIANEIRRAAPLSRVVREVIAACVAGKRDEAYRLLDAGLTELGPHLKALMPSGDMSKYINPIYRFRISGTAPYTKVGLFHIPFQLRHIVGDMRYSVAGLPSLYLGGSTHVCWRELGEPDLATVSVSRFQAVQNTNLRVLNFGHRLPLIGAYVRDKPEDFLGPKSSSVIVAAQVACWPLIAACSIRVPDRAKPERPEYMVPQLVLEWITKTHQFHGIRYFSTHYSEYPDDPKTYMNYVFPAVSNNATGYCPTLCALFEMTDPVTWAEAKAAPPAGGKRPIYKTREIRDAALEAEFGRAEDGLLSLPVGSLTP